jgi:hypothetical protein
MLVIRTAGIEAVQDRAKLVVSGLEVRVEGDQAGFGGVQCGRCTRVIGCLLSICCLALEVS